MNEMEKLANSVQEILNTKGSVKKGVFSLSIERNLDVRVQGRKFSGELEIGIHFESLEADGTALNYAEIVLLPDELPEFTRALGKNDLTITAIHNHWLYAEPNIKYLHVQSVESPEEFAQKLAQAFKVLNK